MGLPHFLYTVEMVPEEHDGACHSRSISKDTRYTVQHNTLIEYEDYR